jgi:hypothetical protein
MSQIGCNKIYIFNQYVLGGTAWSPPSTYMQLFGRAVTTMSSPIVLTGILKPGMLNCIKRIILAFAWGLNPPKKGHQRCMGGVGQENGVPFRLANDAWVGWARKWSPIPTYQ